MQPAYGLLVVLMVIGIVGVVYTLTGFETNSDNTVLDSSQVFNEQPTKKKSSALAKAGWLLKIPSAIDSFFDTITMILLWALRQGSLFF